MKNWKIAKGLSQGKHSLSDYAKARQLGMNSELRFRCCGLVGSSAPAAQQDATARRCTFPLRDQQR